MNNLIDFPRPGKGAKLPDDFRGLTNGGGGGDSGGMEHRIKALEEDVKDIKSLLTDIRIDLARIDAKLGSKVDHKWMIIYFAGLAAVILRTEIAALFS